MIQEVKISYSDKLAMYLKCTKKQLAEMLIEANNILDKSMTVTYENRGNTKIS